jgi:hypothetical protein|nr:hypothetical protein [Actinophrys sol]
MKMKILNSLKFLLKNILIIFLKIILYFNLILCSIFLFFNINNIEKIIKYYLRFISIIVGIILIYILYKSISSILFLFILFLVINFYFILFLYKKGLFKVNSKFISYLLSKDYIFLIQKILIFKFLFLYGYIATNYTYCDSLVSRSMHKVIMNACKENDTAMLPADSVIKTMGALVIFGIVSYGSIKVYRFYQNKPKFSSSNSLDKNKFDIDTPEYFPEDIKDIQEARDIQRHIPGGDVHYRIDLLETKLASIQDYNVKSLNRVRKSLFDIENSFQSTQLLLKENQSTMDTLVRSELSKNLNEMEILLEKNKELILRNHLSIADLRELESLSAELSLLVKSNKKTLLRSSSCPDLTDNNLFNEITYVPLNILDHTSKRLFHGIGFDHIVKFLIVSLDELIHGSISYITFINLLKPFGIKFDFNSMSENIGFSIVNIIKDFLFKRK